MAKPITKAAALALYMAAPTPDEFTEAAHALAAALDRPAKSAAPVVNLAAPLKPLKRTASVVGVLAEWSDGSSTYQNAAYSSPGDRYAAAAQQCDRLRRLRLSRPLARLAEASGERVTINGALGVQFPSPEWLACVRTFPMPALVSLSFEDGETFTPRETFGAGDGEACGASFQAMRDRVQAERDAYQAMCDARHAEYLELVANCQVEADELRAAA